MVYFQYRDKVMYDNIGSKEVIVMELFPNQI